MKEVLSNESGTCPMCDSNDLEYGAFEFQDDNMGYFPWKCNHCGITGEEWYSLEFVGHNVETLNNGYIEIDNLVGEKIEIEESESESDND